jgi:hypothetical protein
MVEQARAYARTCGFIYVLIFVAGLFGEVFVSGRLVVPGDAAATAANVLGSEGLWRAGYAAQVVTMVCDVVVAWLLYVLLAPVQRNLALLAAFFRLTYVAAYVPAMLANAVVLPLAHQSLPQAAFMAVRIHDAAFAVSLVFFGANLALVGYLIGRAPVGVRWLCVALEVAGACYIVNSFAIFIAPHAQAVLFPWILLPPFIAEISLTFWLLFTRRFNAATVA